MEPNALNWPSQRNKRRWAVVWLFFIFIVVLLTSCSIQPRYHNRGFQISLPQAFHNTNTPKAQKSTHRTEVNTRVFNNDTARSMHIPANIIAAGSDQRWVYPLRLSDSMTKPLRTMTIVGDTFLMHGKLVAANENGIFLYNPYDPLFWVSKKPYGKRQSAIREHVLYMPYKDIQSIRKGGTVASKLERLLDGAFKVLFWSIGVIGTLFGVIVADNALNSSSGLEIIAVIAAIVAFIAALVTTIVLSIVLAPIIYLLQLPVKKLRGRYWNINQNPSNGKAFFNFIKARNARYRLYKDEL